jgi:hypothetical protein
MRASVVHETRAAICWIVLAVVPLVSVDCGGGAASADGSSLSAVDGQFVDCAMETNTTPYAPGTLVQSSDGQFAVTLVDNRPGAADANNPPGTWVKGSNTWDIQVSDAAGHGVGGLSIGAKPFMPLHNHGTSITPLTTDDGDGRYVISPLYLYMGGYWQITLNIRVPLSDGGAGAALHNDSAVFNICIPG